MKYNELTIGQIEAVVNKLDGMIGVNNFLSGKTIVRPAGKTFEVWKTIKIDVFNNINKLEKEMKNNGCVTAGHAGIMIKSTFSQVKEISLVKILVADLGFNNDVVTYKDICNKAKEFGLKLCPNEIGPQLCIQYKNEPRNEFLNIAMEPIVYPEILNPDELDSNLNIFAVSGNILISNNAQLFGPDECFIFCLCSCE